MRLRIADPLPDRRVDEHEAEQHEHAASRRASSIGTRGVTVLVMRRPSMRACGRNSSARNRIIVGIANDAELQRPDHVQEVLLERDREPDDHAADVGERQALAAAR